MKGTNKLLLSHIGMVEVVQAWMNDKMYRAEVLVDSVTYASAEHLFVIELKEKPEEPKK